MDIAVFGDSFLFGSDLKDCEQTISRNGGSPFTWTKLLAQKLNIRHWGFSQPGIGNLAIADDVLRILSQKGNQVLYSVHWTWIDRLDYVPGIYDEDYVGRSWIKEFPHKVDAWRPITPASKEHFAKSYYKYISSEFVDKLRNLTVIDNTINLLKEYNCTFHMTYQDYLLTDNENNTNKSINFLQNRVKKHLQNYDGKNFLDWAKHHKFPISDNWHPLEQAHESASEYWLPTYTRLINTHAKEDYLHAFI